MSDETHSTSLMGKHFDIKCPPNKIDRLQQAATHLTESMTLIQQTGDVHKFEHLLVTAALNLTDELLNLKSTPPLKSYELDSRIENLRNKIEDVLA